MHHGPRIESKARRDCIPSGEEGEGNKTDQYWNVCLGGSGKYGKYTDETHIDGLALSVEEVGVLFHVHR